MGTITQLMNDGTTALNSGHLDTAISYFEQAHDLIGESVTAEILQQLGICYRLANRRLESARAFETALALAKTRTHRGQILRDCGMLYLEHDNVMALSDFNTSCRLLTHPNATEWSTPQSVEHAVSVGFLGRARMALGDRERAYVHMLAADQWLHGQAPYELNNLVWLLKVAPLTRRLAYAKRALALARQAGNRERYWQIILIVVCRPLGVRMGS